jgi:hypothetical protein
LTDEPRKELSKKNPDTSDPLSIIAKWTKKNKAMLKKQEKNWSIKIETKASGNRQATI